jgi:alanine racemase
MSSPATHSSLGTASLLTVQASAEVIEQDRLVMEIDLDAVGDNARLAVEVGADHPIIVLKGDAYGMGIEAVGPRLKAVGIARFATDNSAEAVRLRDAGVDGPVIVFYGEPAERVEVYLDHDLMPVLYDSEQVSACARACRERGAALSVWIGANIGFNRAGGRTLEGFEALAAELADQAGHLRVVGVLAHLTASHLLSSRNEAELGEFRTRVEAARARFGEGIEKSLLASHGLLRWGSRDDTGPARPGLMLTGEHWFAPEVLREEGRTAALAGRLRPAVSLRARVIHLLRTESHQTLGYAPGTPVRPGRLLATVALGFRTGFPVLGEPSALCREKLVERVGPLGMDSLQVDVTEVPDIAVGDWITFCGREGDVHLGLERICATAGVTPYQFLSGLQVPRTYTTSVDSKEECNK